MVSNTAKNRERSASSFFCGEYLPAPREKRGMLRGKLKRLRMTLRIIVIELKPICSGKKGDFFKSFFYRMKKIKKQRKKIAPYFYAFT